MQSFKDTEGREWVISVNVATVKRIKAKLDLDLLDKLGMEAIGQLAEDPIRLADVLFVVLEPEIEKRGLTDETFGAALSGDALEQAAVSFMEALADFFPSARRQVIQKALSKMQAVETKVIGRAMAILDSDQLNQKLEEIMSQDPVGELSGKSLES